MVQQTVKTHEEHIAEIWKMFKESRQETDRKIKDTDRKIKDTDRYLKELDDIFNLEWDRLVGCLRKDGNLIKLLKQKGIEVESIFGSTNHYGEEKWWFDMTAVARKEIVVVDIKTTLGTEDVKCFLKRLSKVKQYLHMYKDRAPYGAVAYFRKNDGADLYAEKQGLFVIRATGNSASITNQENFKPKAFS